MQHHEYHIDKVYYCDGDGAAVTFKVVNEKGDVLDNFDTYTKAERRIVDLLERENQ